MSRNPWTTDPFAPPRPADSPAHAVVPLRAWTDGAAKGNPGPAGWAWWASDECWAAGGWPSASNNLAELTAVAEVLAATSHLAHLPIIITTDSTYVRDAMTSWIHGWKRNGWRTRDGSPVKNAEVIRAIDERMRGRDVTIAWVRGHQDDAGNVAADARCSAYADAVRRGARPDPGPGWTAG